MMLLTSNACLTCLFCLAILLSYCFAAETSYEKHCGDIVPASTLSGHTLHPNIALNLQGAYISSNASLKILHNLSLPGSLYFHPLALFSTQNTNVFKVHANLHFRDDALQYLAFNLSGFHSTTTGKICMVGPGMNMSGKGTKLSFFAVVKLAYPVNSNITNCLVHGTFECLDASRNLSRSDKISILDYSANRYNYTMTSQVEEACSSVQSPVLESLGLNASEACNYLQSLQNLLFVLEFQEHYSIFSRFMSFSYVHCRKDGKVNLFISFTNESTESFHSSTLSPLHSLVSEGYWDSEKNCLCLIACRIHKDPYVGECDIGLTLWFPFFTLKNRNTISGLMWSLKEQNHPRYFRQISFRSINYVRTHPNLSYRYTENSYLRMSCDSNNDTYRGDKLFTNDYSMRNYMGFEFSFRDSKNVTMLGSAMLLSVGDIFFGNSHYLFAAELASGHNQSIWNVSYDIFYMQKFKVDSGIRTEISAEGFYNSKLGKLCMVGCRLPNYSSSKKNSDTMDCEIQIDIQFSSLKYRDCDARGHRSLLNGTIKSTRKKHDPLYFDTLVLSSPAIHIPGARELIYTMNRKITMVLTSLSFLCILVYFQLSNIMKSQDVLQFKSITTLVLLTIGYFVPVAPSIIKAYYGSGECNVCGEDHESIMIAVIIVIMSTPYLLIRLFCTIWKSRNARRRTLMVSILLYSLEVIILACIGYFTKWDDTTWYCGLIHDCLLLSQMIERVWKSKENAVDPLLNVGTKAVRTLLPYLFDVCSPYCLIYLDILCESTIFLYVLLIGVMFVVTTCLGKKLGRGFFFSIHLRRLVGH